MTARVLPMDRRPHHRVINRRPLTDATALLPVIDAGRYALGRMQLVSPTRAATITTALTLWAGTDPIREALVALAETAADLDLRIIDRHDPQQRDEADMIEADAAEVPAVVTALTPRMGPGMRDLAWQRLVDAVTRLLDLRAHDARGEVPRYLRREGRSAQDTVAAEEHDVQGIITDALAVLCVHGHRSPDLPDGAA
jgi:hypothetical protein